MRDDVVVTDAERRVADMLPMQVDAGLARRTADAIPFWFHTFALNRAAGIYTPGAARDHRYRLASLPRQLDGRSVLDVGTFDGFYAFLAEHDGASRVVAVDNEQYRLWVAARWGVKLAGGEGFRAIHKLLGSTVEYRRIDAFSLADLDETFDVIYCFGLLHRVENPLGLLRVLRTRTARRGSLLLETYGTTEDDARAPSITVAAPGGIYARDAFVYWGFGFPALERLAVIAGFSAAVAIAQVEVDGHPRIVCRLDP
ncbi:MAG TPA: DUF1698 domain-containing protein [Solirubrobacteraceae bacterium]|jgi:tRNA (mo5U34)-methyltransferase